MVRVTKDNINIYADEIGSKFRQLADASAFGLVVLGLLCVAVLYVAARSP